MARLLLSLFLTGFFLGAGPCLLSCGPLLVSYIVATKKSPWGGLKAYLLFSLTRLVVYSFFGITAGIFGQEILYRFFDSTFLKIIFYLFGIFVVFLGLLLLVEKLPVSSCCVRFNKLFFSNKDWKNIILFGLIVSFAPCLPLTTVLGYITLLADHWFKGFLMALAFGFGTIVSPMIIFSLGAGRLGEVLIKSENIFNWIKAGCGLILVFLGVLLILSARSISFPGINF